MKSIRLITLQCGIVFLLWLAAFVPGRAQTEPYVLTVLHFFTAGADGANSSAGLIMDGAGNFYGTTQYGGYHGVGTVFKLDPSGTLTVLHSFTVDYDGAEPYARLMRDGAGNLYGTTTNGGFHGFGTVFKLNASGQLTWVHSFDVSDGAWPESGLIMDSAGNLYFTTRDGPSGEGAVLKLDTSLNLTVLHSFTGADGAVPDAGLIMDGEGSLYGTTEDGGASGNGTVFKLDPSGNETVLHSFTGAPYDGGVPIAGLIMDTAGNFYGTTAGGGTYGFGTVFKLDNAGNETVLHSFTDKPDGSRPLGDLIMDSAGNLYGTTQTGGTSGNGTVFKLDTSGSLTVLHSFTGADGASPDAGLIMDSAGNLYGTTSGGGTSIYGFGTVFKLSRQPTSTTSLSSSPNPANVGQTVTLTASVAPASATGSVSFYDRSTLLGVATLSNDSASLNVTTLPPGTRRLAAVYSGDRDDPRSTSPVLIETIVGPTTTTSLMSSLNPANAGQTVTLTASVAPASATGSVSFYNSSTLLGVATLSNGSASLNVSTLTPGTRRLAAIYSGDNTHADSTSGVLLQTIIGLTSTTSVATSANPGNFGQQITLSATVAPVSATGLVSFYDHNTFLGTGMLSGGRAAFSVSSLTPGWHWLGAFYNGDSSYAESTSAALFERIVAPTTTTVVSVPNPANLGQPVILTATVAPATVTGSVFFYDQSTLLGKAVLSGGSGSLSISSLALGSHRIAAVYAGDTKDTTSTSAVLIQTINATP
jgi:uncharacterized repeat protein (TIGR03803 family)